MPGTGRKALIQAGLGVIFDQLKVFDHSKKKPGESGFEPETSLGRLVVHGPEDCKLAKKKNEESRFFYPAI
jgi:hypothetical protein